MISINNITVERFKAHFTRDFPYLPYWQYGKAYFIGDIVFYNFNFFKSKTDNNLNMPEVGDNWEIIPENEENYITDDDISKAFIEAKAVFPQDLIKECDIFLQAYLYLAAHYLVIDINNAANSLSMGFQAFTQSKSVGSVSESYGIPQWAMNNPVYSQYMQTGYGRKYFSLIMPYLKAASLPILSKGRVTGGW